MTHLRLALLLATVFALSPLAIDTYLPAMAAMAADLQAAPADIAVTISIYILGLALGQFVGGPLSDLRGRRPVMLVGLVIFAAASALLALSETLPLLWGARFVQAVGGGMAAVVVPAVVRDRTEGRETAKLFALLGLIMISAPALAPSIGTLLLHVSGWRSIFVFLAVYALLALALIAVFLPTAAGGAPSSGNSEPLLARYRHVLGHRVAMGYLLAQALAFSCMAVFLAHASTAYIGFFQLSETAFSALFAANVGAMAAVNRLNSFLLNRFEPPRLLHWALCLQAAACLGLLLAVQTGAGLWLVAPMIMLAVGALGGIAANSAASCLHYFPRHSGIASALLGTAQYLLAALISGVSTLFIDGSLWPLALGMALSSVLALLVLQWLSGEARQQPLATASVADCG